VTFDPKQLQKPPRLIIFARRRKDYCSSDKINSNEKVANYKIS